MKEELARLNQEADLRRIWPDEARDFTPWLSQAENLSLLSESLGMGAEGLQFEAQERFVGPFRADILCRDTADGSWVLIENQLEPTNHTHLGQIVTYGAGLEASTIVWISTRFTEPHRAALDWLNTISGENFRFFGVEVELWRIGNSLPAPRFNIVASPNDWSKSVKDGRRAVAGPLSERKQLQLRYWTALAEVLRERNSPVRARKPFPDSWHEFSIGRAGFALQAFANTAERTIRVQLFIYGNMGPAKQFLDALRVDQAAIEHELGPELVWDRLEGRQGAHVSHSKSGIDPSDEDDWSKQHDWLADRLSAFHRTFYPRIRTLSVPLELDE